MAKGYEPRTRDNESKVDRRDEDRKEEAKSGLRTSVCKGGTGKMYNAMPYTPKAHDRDLEPDEVLVGGTKIFYTKKNKSIERGTRGN